MHTTLNELLKDGPVVADGAWGTELQAKGLAPGESPDLWNLEFPDRVEAVARSYVEAGSRVILSNTFGANRFVLEGHGLAEKMETINRRGAEISRRAAGSRVKVFASLGPSGKMLMTGEVTEEALFSAFAAQAKALAAGGVAGIVVETMTDLGEAVQAVRAAKTTSLPVVACMVFDSGKDGDRTMMGVSIEQAAEGLLGAGADVLGANCGKGIEGFEPIARRLVVAAGGAPVWVKPNAGLPVMEGGRIVYRATPDGFAKAALGLLDAGASFVGGCCGTTPGFIKAVAAGVEFRKRR
ncbi:MAG: homocysteine S-methyltransferase family protein [Planctomycetota bacterium]